MKKRITISTWEEQEELTRQYSASLTPVQRLVYLKELNDRVFSKQIEEQKGSRDRKIKFIKIK